MAAMTNGIILMTSNDWDDWYEGVQRKAISLGLCEYTDLDAEPTAPPTKPEPYKPNMEGTRPEIVEIYSHIYGQRMEEYETYTEDAKTLCDHISATIDPKLREVLTQTPHPRQILEELKGFMAPTKFQREMKLTDLFLKLSKPSEVRKRSTDKWLMEWERCHELVLKYNVGGLTSELGNLYRFLNAVQAIHPEFSVSDFRRQKLEDTLANGDQPLSVEQMIYFFRIHYRTRIS
ncbi:hypothetical protein ACJ72_06246 [Emergomyces africanus]|uniref:Uncharacterized protein n=1 Tax=Emergomyces africanus TaxID=1955775 RepID=A0A1B7NRP1_9EURO|nr:hypothetical protein ACJ72_06246 [Emergomyces africanus]